MVRSTRQMATDALAANHCPSPRRFLRWAVMLTLLPLDSRPRRIKSPKMS